jgi:putative transcriptional regulator
MRHATAVDKIPGSIREARAILRGESAGELIVHVPPDFDVKALRRKLGMSQSKFAASFGFGLDAVQSREQGRRRPEGPAGVLLKVFEHEPDAVRRALAASLRTDDLTCAPPHNARP